MDLVATPVVAGLSRPVYLTAPVGDDRLFVVEKSGRVLVLGSGDSPGIFLDLQAAVSSANEQGLLSLAFHPDYGLNGHFYLNYTDQSGTTVVSRFTVSADPDLADPASESVVLQVQQPWANHNGGHLLFGPDGMLHIPLGDGGSGGDPLGNGQDLSTMLGSILRINVDSGTPYSIPPDNPFSSAGGDTIREIWHYGLRNPWRVAFDDAAGFLYIADVGQGAWEEISVVPANQGGLNFGWNITEGTHCFSPSSGCDLTGLTLPLVEYGHDPACSVTGGYVYRGSALPALQGHYFYADYCAGWVRSFRLEGGVAINETQWELGDLGRITSFGLDGHGELYILVDSGTVYRLEEVADPES
jgi:glucose/arabinose dehydrogenase